MPSIYGRIVTDNLVFATDALDYNSYVSGSSVWRDMSPNRYTGSITGAPQMTPTAGNGLYFNGVDYYCKFTGVTPVQLASSSLSVNVIFSIPTNDQPGSNILFIHDYESSPGNGGNFGWRVELSGTIAGYIGFSLSSIGSYYNYNKYILPNVIQNVTITVSGSNLTFYDNDTLSYVFSSLPLYPTHLANTYSFSRTFFGSTSPCMNTVYAVRIYDKILSQQEITQNYLAHKSRFK